MDAILETLRRLGLVKVALLAGVAIGLIAFFSYVSTRLAAPPMALLYSELTSQDAGQIISRLEAQGITHELRAGGTQIWAPADRVLRLRMSLAEQGMPRGGAVGYEIFDRADTLGTTSFTQGLNHLRALEGELARTISSLSPVQGARVHLVIPKRELFTRERQEPTASVVLRMRDAGRLPKHQVLAIQHLVAAGVQGLKPARVSVIDDRGNLLARGTGEGEDGQSAASNADDMRRSYEQRLARTIEDMLERSLGPGKVRAEVSAEMDFDRIVTNSESFDPEGQVVRSTQTVSESSSGSDGAGGQPTSVGSNLPGGDPSAAGGRSSNQSARNEETVNYEITRTTRSHVREAGTVKRLSVAVLVDGGVAPGADGKRAYTPRKPEEIQQITALVRSAVGFNQQRGDTLEVVNLPFNQLEESVVESSLMSMIDLTKQDYFRIAELLALAITAILVILLVARPMVNNLFKVMPAAAAAGAGTGSGQAALVDRSGGTAPALAAPDGAEGAEVPNPVEQMIDLNQVEGRVRASSIKKIGEIVEKHPDEAVAIVRNWMYQDK